jgi:hypothetical protein
VADAVIDLVLHSCPHCSATNVRTTLETEILPYGEPGPDQVKIQCEIVVRHCDSCKESWLDWVGEGMRDRAIQVWKEEDGG